jgi:hypothetical protein
LVAENEEAAKAMSGEIEWFASHRSLLHMDAVCLGLSIDQRSSSVITPSLKRVPSLKNTTGSKAKEESENHRSKGKEKEKREKTGRFSRPKGQKLRKNRIG